MTDNNILSSTHRISTGDTDFDWLIFMGRFAPWTRGHAAVAERALAHTKKLLIITGSDKRPPTLRNPFSTSLRHEIIRNYFLNEQPDAVRQDRVVLSAVEDFTYRDPLWLEAVQDQVMAVSKPGDKIGLCGWEKDGTSYYLRKFPQWGSHIAVTPVDGDRIVNATDVRNDFWDDVLLMENAAPNDPRVYGHRDIHSSTADILTTLIRDPVQVALAKRRAKIIHDNEARKPVGGMTWDQPAACGDAMITCSGHVALIQRGDNGLWGFPGGHFDSKRKRSKKVPHGDGNLFDTAVGEAFEELGFPTLSRDALIRSAVDEYFFDDINRDERGLYVTRCVHFKLVDRASGLPEIHAGDDAVDGRWFPFSEFTSLIATHDHFDMFNFMALRQLLRTL